MSVPAAPHAVHAGGRAGGGVAPLRERMRPRVSLHYPGFDRTREISVAAGATAPVYAFADEDCRAWYRRFADDVLSAVEARRFLPVYRMGDGEFSFALGSREEQVPIHRLRPRQAARRLRDLLTGRRGAHRSGSAGYGWEVYSRAERAALLDAYAADLRLVAERGWIAAALDRSPQYAAWLPGILDWFDARGVALHAGNYQHVYAVYALLHGPDRARLLGGRRVLVVNHVDDARRAAIAGGLARAGAAEARFLSISREKAMLERLDPRALDAPADLVLVGAGVGAARVLRQLEPLGAPALDVGFALDVLARPELRWTRPFCVADGEMDPARVRWLPPRPPADERG